MEALFNILLILHIIGGGISLIAGLVVVLIAKGNRLHRRWGTVFFWSLLLSATVAIPMCALHPNYFLFLISIFTLYMLLTGVRALKLCSSHTTALPDWLLTVAITVFGVLFAGLGVYNLTEGVGFGAVFVTFGGVGLLFAYQDWVNFKGHSRIKNFFLTTHLQRLTGSYIASVTAFLVVNNRVLPDFVAWLLPTVLLTPIIFKWSRKYGVPTLQ